MAVPSFHADVDGTVRSWTMRSTARLCSSICPDHTANGRRNGRSRRRHGAGGTMIIARTRLRTIPGTLRFSQLRWLCPTLRCSHSPTFVGNQAFHIAHARAQSLQRSFPPSIVMTRPTHVICATDLSDTSPAAVELAGRLAQQRGARLHLVHVVENPFHQPWLSGTIGIDLAELLQRRIDNAEHELDTMASTLPPTAPSPFSSVMIGRPADEIVRHARDYDADLIVIGTHDHDGMQRALLGSVADRVIRQAPCPVLVVPSRSREGAPVAVGTARAKREICR